MRSQHIWTERDEQGSKREVRATRFGGIWRLQAKTAGDLDWTCYERALVEELLLGRGSFPSREQARRAILAGKVSVATRVADKPSELLDEQTAIAIKPTRKYVGRGALKLESALDHFGIDVHGKTALDIGSSTGGFTDCMLQRGAEKVYAVDVGYGQLDWKLRNDPRVVVFEKTNARFLTRDQVQEVVDICVIDVSFISLTL